MEKTVNIVNNSSPRCPYCHESVEASVPKHGCQACMAWHHDECWREHGGCSACGFRERNANPILIPHQGSQTQLPNQLVGASALQNRDLSRPAERELTSSQLGYTKHTKELAQKELEKNAHLVLAYCLLTLLGTGIALMVGAYFFINYL